MIELILHWLTQPERWTGGPDSIPTRVLEHLAYSGAALLLASVIAMPLGLFTGHTGRGGFLAVNSGNATRSLPTIGLVILTVTMLGLGLTPVLLPLTVLAIPPILVNTYEGVRQVDRELRDAALGMGMTGWQVLLRLEIPIALPLIVLGLRTAAIQIVSTATIAAYVGLGGLGRFIFDGLARRDYEVMLGGAALAAVLAVLVEAVFVLLGRAVVSQGVRQ